MKRSTRRHSTVAASPPPRTARPSTVAAHRDEPPLPPRHHVPTLVDQSDRTLVDVLDNLLNRGVVLNAEIVLALADVDLVYVRLSALLCAADRLFPRDDSR